MLDWASTSFSQVEPFEIALLALVSICVLRPMRMSFWRLLLLVAVIHMALSHRRHVDIFVVVAPILLAEPLSRAFPELASPRTTERTVVGGSIGAIAVAVGLVIAGVRVMVPNQQVNGLSPTEALSHVPAPIAAQPVFNEDVLGGFLIWNGIKTFIDSRQEMVTDAFFEDYIRMCAPDRESIVRTFSRYKIRWTILSPNNAANSILDTLPRWRVLYSDKFAVVHVRDDGAIAHPSDGLR
jgi:hypothetical protein